jgi:hypothetical protein
MSFPDLSDPFTKALRLADRMGGGTVGGSSSATQEKTGFEAEVEELILKESKQKQLDEYRSDFMSAWLIKRTKSNPDRYKFLGTNIGSLAGLINAGNLSAKGSAEDRLVVLGELINLITGSETTGQITGLLEITQKAFEREDGSAGKYSPYIKELYAAGLGLDGIDDAQLDQILAGKKYKGKTYTLKDIANDQRFIIDAHKKMLDRKEKLNELVEDFSYSKLGPFGKFANFNWFGHQMIAGTASGLVLNRALGSYVGINHMANYATGAGKTLAGISDDVLARSNTFKYLVGNSFTGKNTKLAGLLQSFNRTSFHSTMIGRLGKPGAASAWNDALKMITSKAGTTGYELTAGGITKTFALDKVDDAAKFLIKNGAVSNYANASGWSKLAGFARGAGKGILRTLLGRSLKGIGVAALAGFAISGLFWMKEKGGVKASINELGGKAYNLGKDVLGPLDLVPDYGSWAA